MVTVSENFIKDILCDFLVHICLNIVNPYFVELWDQQTDSLRRFSSKSNIRNYKSVKKCFIFIFIGLTSLLTNNSIKNIGQALVAYITLINYQWKHFIFLISCRAQKLSQYFTLVIVYAFVHQGHFVVLNV